MESGLLLVGFFELMRALAIACFVGLVVSQAVLWFERHRR